MSRPPVEHHLVDELEADGHADWPAGAPPETPRPTYRARALCVSRCTKLTWRAPRGGGCCALQNRNVSINKHLKEGNTESARNMVPSEFKEAAVLEYYEMPDVKVEDPQSATSQAIHVFSSLVCCRLIAASRGLQAKRGGVGGSTNSPRGRVGQGQVMRCVLLTSSARS